MTKTALSLSGIITLAFAFAVGGADAPQIDKSKLPPAATKQGISFNSHVKPIFEQSCVKCHGPEKPKGKLRLDNLEDALKGSEHGKVLKVGNSADSTLVHLVARLGDPDNHMPPPNNKANIPPLTTEQVSVIRAWIDQGAK